MELNKIIHSDCLEGFLEAHFATFPEEIPAICIKAGCPENGVVLDDERVLLIRENG